jgi:hypothetical protein
MKKIIRLTEQDLVKLVKRVINESDDDDESKLISLLTSSDIDNVKLGLILYDSQDIKVDKYVVDKAKSYVLIRYLIKLSNFEVNNFADELGFGDWFKGKNIDNSNYKTLELSIQLSKKIVRFGHWNKIKDKVLYS